jgi:hypothetical protein
MVLLIQDIPEKSILELFLKSYLYLMLGNSVRSDIYLGMIKDTAPKINWMRGLGVPVIYHHFTFEHLNKILKKIASHPSDRTILNNTIHYLKKYYSQEFIEIFDDVIKSDQSLIADSINKWNETDTHLNHELDKINSISLDKMNFNQIMLKISNDIFSGNITHQTVNAALSPGLYE